MAPTAQRGTAFAIVVAGAAGAAAGAALVLAWVRRRERDALTRVLRAAVYAAHAHRDQRRKSPKAEPYFNHPLRVAAHLAAAGAPERAVIAALLHDVVEDTATTLADVDAEFGPDIAHIVGEVSDDKALPSAERKRLQIVNAPHISTYAKYVKIADKLDNLHDLTNETPVGWEPRRVKVYFDWAEKVIDNLRGTHRGLESNIDKVLAQRDVAVETCIRQSAANNVNHTPTTTI